MPRPAPRLRTLALATLGLAALVGCEGTPTLFPNPDPNLRHTSTELAADAAKRFPYKAEAPRAREDKARAQVKYSMNRLEIVQFTGQDWDDVEVWVNRTYVCYVPKMQDRKLKEVHFPMLFNEKGNKFPFDNSKVRVERVEVLRDGTIYEVTSQVAE